MLVYDKIVVLQAAVANYMILFRIISLCANNQKGINDKVIENAVPNVDVHQRVAAINRLLTMVSSVVSRVKLCVVHFFFREKLKC